MASAKGVAIVTGGGGGIGAAIAKGLAAGGYAVVVNYANNESAAAKTVAEIIGSGGTALAVQADVAEEAAVIRLFETVDRRLGVPAVLVNNGGVTGGFSRLADLPASAL